MSALTARAPAKINLALHVVGRRADGYHLLESLVAFAGVGDHLSLAPGDALGLDVRGPTAPLAGSGPDNLVLRAARHLADEVGGLRYGLFTLVKRLPVAAGIGGGSSDAAAALRLLARLNGLPPGHPALLAAARRTGADVPVCLEPRARMMRGVGESLGPALTLPPLYAVLVNPGVPLETAPVFRALGLPIGAAHPGPSHPSFDGEVDQHRLLARLREARNDLEAPALGLAPVIGDALATLRAVPGCRLARMSGSGATVFGLFDDCHLAARAARTIAAGQPGWWVRPTLLR